MTTPKHDDDIIIINLKIEKRNCIKDESNYDSFDLTFLFSF